MVLRCDPIDLPQLYWTTVQMLGRFSCDQGTIAKEKMLYILDVRRNKRRETLKAHRQQDL